MSEMVVKEEHYSLRSRPVSHQLSPEEIGRVYPDPATLGRDPFLVAGEERGPAEVVPTPTPPGNGPGTGDPLPPPPRAPPAHPSADVASFISGAKPLFFYTDPKTRKTQAYVVGDTFAREWTITSITPEGARMEARHGAYTHDMHFAQPPEILGSGK
jgi:hypothetical protein